ncbi:MAG TPA: SDR family oxidoreductase [Terriglobales bacterium]|nr:SDR family oxidoreductase [Terriglobales bacterium]
MSILEGRIAIITGASSGIGRACAIRFAEEGASLVVCARRLDRLQSLVEEIKAAGSSALPVACDVAKEADITKVVQAAMDRFGRIDILANIAQGGMDKFGGLMDTKAEDVLDAFRTGALQSFLFMQKCFPYMKERGYGRIINTSSPAAVTGISGLTAYIMTKGAIMALTRNASQEWGKFGIVTNTFLPWVRTENFDRSDLAKNLVAMEASSPLGRMGTPYEDCTPMVAFLASEGAGYINGQVIAVDGGRRLIG